MAQKIYWQNKSLVDKKAQEQVEKLLDNPCLENSNIALMSDCHALVGIVPVGFSATLNDGIIDPNIISADMSCGITIHSLGDWEPHRAKGKWDYDDFVKIDNIIRGTQIDQQKRFSIGELIRGKDSFDNIIIKKNVERAMEIIDTLIEKEVINKNDFEHIMSTFATIGNGNHFIELSKDNEGQYYLAVHSGSRGLGALVHKYFVNNYLDKKKREYKEKIKDILQNVPEKEKQSVVMEYKKEHNENYKYCSVPIDEYYQINKLVYEWAYLSRDTMLNIIIDGLGLITKQNVKEKDLEYFKGRKLKWNLLDNEVEEVLNISHNWLEKRNGVYIARKGAVPNWDNEPIAIALNLARGIVIGTGKTSEEMCFTAPHGAGRLFSRTQAKQEFTLEQFKQIVKENNVYSSTVNEKTLDEIPMAYKDSDIIISDLEKVINIEKILVPVYNFKCEN